MGHRALVAYQRPDHLYDLRYSHWGGDDLSLSRTLTSERPLGRGTVDSELLADSVSLERVLTGYLDPCVHEALFLVDQGFEITSYRVCWLEWGDGREEGRGAIVAVEPGPDDLALRTWFRATKTAVADFVEMGALSRRAARSYLEARVCEDQDGRVYSYGLDESSDGSGSRSDSNSDAVDTYGNGHDRDRDDGRGRGY